MKINLQTLIENNFVVPGYENAHHVRKSNSDNLTIHGILTLPWIQERILYNYKLGKTFVNLNQSHHEFF